MSGLFAKHPKKHCLISNIIDQASPIDTFSSPRKRSRRSVKRSPHPGRSAGRDWETRMEGFAGLEVLASLENKRSRMKTASVRTQQPSNDAGSSQVDIDWESGSDSADEADITDHPETIPKHTPNQEATTKSQEASIADYDSDEQELLDSPQQVDPPEDFSESPHISFPTQSSSPEDQTCSAVNTTKASDWVKGLQWQLTTPEKSTEDLEEARPVDSAAKKKQNYVRGGLADRARKLLTRQRASQRFRMHQMTSYSSQDLSTALTVEVLQTRKEAALLVTWCRCTETGSSDSMEQNHKTQEQTPISSLHSLPLNKNSHQSLLKSKYEITANSNFVEHGGKIQKISEHTGKKLIILFEAELAKKNQVESGAMITVYPPWQKLCLTTGQDVVLCTSSYRVCQQDHTQITKQKHFHPLPIATAAGGTDLGFSMLRQDGENDSLLIATWQCPCLLDRRMDAQSCPAHVNPVNPSYVIKHPQHFPGSLTANRSTGLHGNGSNLTVSLSLDSQHHPGNATSDTVDRLRPPPVPTGDSSLHTVTSPSPPWKPCYSILESIERAGSSDVSFVATVQRVFCRKTPSSGSASCIRPTPSLTSGNSDVVTWSLLLQDCHGGLCQLQLPLSCDEKPMWRPLVEGSEGHVCKFSGLSVVRRMNRTKSMGLFSMVDTVWSAESVRPRVTGTSQESSQEMSQNPAMVPPGFCYILSASFGESNWETLNTSSSIYREPVSLNLGQLPGDVTHHRISFIAKLFYAKIIEKDSIQNEAAILYVSDATLRTGFVRVQVSAGVVLPESLSSKSNGNNLLFFRDILCHQDIAQCDVYSRVLVAPSTTKDDLQLTDTKLTLSALDGNTESQHLVTVTGCVYGVDEESAFSWEECNRCGNENLSGGDATCSFLYCSNCHKAVNNPVTRMKMDVLIRCSGLENYQVKVKLLQATIEAMLPTEADEEGYDLQSVLGQSIGPLTCLVLSTSRDKVHNKKNFLLEQVQINR